MSAAGYGAAVGALFGAFAKKKEIEFNNAAALSAYKATSEALTLTQGINWNRAAETTRITTSESNMKLIDAKAEITKGISEVAITRGEGITAGTSAARTVSTALLQSSKAVEGVKIETQSKVNDMWSATEDANYQLQQQKVSAYNNLKTSLVTGDRAVLQVVGAAIGGAQAGASMGSAAGSSFSGGSDTAGAPVSTVRNRRAGGQFSFS